jgi:Transcriptional Coactivator p15 (PC4)
MPKTGFPIIIAEWPRNNRELVRISLDRFNGCFTIDVRFWWRDPNGVFKPGRDGLTLGVKHLPKLADGLCDARQRAEAIGLIEPATKSKDRTAAERQRRYRRRHNGGVTA